MSSQSEPELADFECDGCGACCRTFPVFASGTDAEREPRVAYEGKSLAVHLEAPGWKFQLYPLPFHEKCCFLDHQNKCTIYPTRPQVCRDFNAGSSQCQEARARAGLSELLPTNPNPSGAGRAVLLSFVPYLRNERIKDMAVKPIPDGFHSITPYLLVRGGEKAIEFYKKAFGAVEKDRMVMPDGKIGHAELKIGDSIIMLADEMPDMGMAGPETLGGVGMSLLLYVDDVDAIFAKALEAGATETRAIEDKFYGDRMGNLKDPFGHSLSLATHKEDLTPE